MFGSLHFRVYLYWNIDYATILLFCTTDPIGLWPIQGTDWNSAGTKTWINSFYIFHILSVLRCLGIPARVITNYNSAHDNTGNLKTDILFNADGSPDRRNTRDSIWYRIMITMFLWAWFGKGFSARHLFSWNPPMCLNSTSVGSALATLPLSAGTTTAGTRWWLSVLICRPGCKDGRWLTPRLRRPVTVRQTDERAD